MKRWLQFSLAAFLTIPLIVALGLFAYKKHIAQIELQDRISFIDEKNHLSDFERSIYRKIVSNEENRPHFAGFNLVRNSEANIGNFLYHFHEIVDLKDNVVVVIKGGFGRPAYVIFQLDKSNKIRKLESKACAEFLKYKIAGDSIIVTCRHADFGSALNDEFEIVFDHVE